MPSRINTSLGRRSLPNGKPGSLPQTIRQAKQTTLQHFFFLLSHMKMPRLPRLLPRYLIMLKRIFRSQVIYRTRFLINHTLDVILRITDAAIPAVSLLATGVVIYDVGFRAFYSFGPITYRLLAVCLILLRILMVGRFVAELREKKRIWSHVFSFLLIVLTIYLYDLLLTLGVTEPLRTNDFLVDKLLLYGGLLFIFSTEASDLLRFVYRRSLNPAFLDRKSTRLNSSH